MRHVEARASVLSQALVAFMRGYNREMIRDEAEVLVARFRDQESDLDKFYRLGMLVALRERRSDRRVCNAEERLDRIANAKEPPEDRAERIEAASKYLAFVAGEPAVLAIADLVYERPPWRRQEG